MNTKSIIFLILVGFGILAAIVFFNSSNNGVSEMSQESPSATTKETIDEATDALDSDEKMDSENVEEPKSISLSEISEHNSVDDCWFAIEDKVYDVTEYIAGEKHPGKDAILAGCGLDATEIFNDRPNGSGTHSENARSFLPNFEIGELSSE